MLNHEIIDNKYERKRATYVIVLMLCFALMICWMISSSAVNASVNASSNAADSASGNAAVSASGNAIGKAATKKLSKPKGIMSTAAGGKVVVTWEKVKKANKYIVYQAKGKELDKQQIKSLAFEKVVVTKKAKAVISGLEKGNDYHYYVIAVKDNGSSETKSGKSAIRSTTLPKKGKSTIKNLLRTGLAPIGSTLYVWGGGWNKADTGTGKTAKRNGLYPAWRSFYNKHKKKYNFTRHRYKIVKGLDCSGFVGWTVYNNMRSKNGQSGFVTWAVNQGKWFAKKGFGKYVSAYKVKSHKAGDIMTCPTHVWISVGECKDGSTVILHASPPAVSLAGTPSSKGKQNSQAVKLARKYMKKYYSALYKNSPSIVKRKSSYNTDYGCMRWNSKTLSDPEGYRKMSAAEVLKDLFSEK